ncbi:hypothetical protein [Mycobacterium spongiae]|uniref:hypothetical protein n=1 Tax=Mycobacterium spongiae TaxID=886343 RepID=UPI001BA62CD6|nr:hypothetical protein [Mycobacterium spongiae]
MSLSGYAVREDGRMIRAARTTTASEASARSERLHKLLAARGAHPAVVRHSRSELLRKDCYEAVFEAVKGLGSQTGIHLGTALLRSLLSLGSTG